ncbi:MAG: hypothetical protein A2021_08750 [Elusimicrobia bacterium GWF2_52_66]|nr:MAG: hypothetical protein A2X33_10680 [Elusimicrobia bacterium GWA2_51_34]OGR85504.1 MAG: hypothetical protein A2021_08750 [Elusimicrobia bacterium GWF2_52_66]HAF95159.1 hypothetical protein [Elusimicrobiota bacterium]HCE98411.1 hypothetical protein [Elusimicrobiota bacterium]
MNLGKTILIAAILSLGALSQARALSTGRHSHTTTLLPDGNFLVVGGVTGSGNVPTETAEIYITSKTAFESAASLPGVAATVRRSSHTATVFGDGQVLIAGGFNSGTPLDTAFLFDNRTNSWSAVGSNMLSARGGHTATLINKGPNSGSVLICGGQTTAAYPPVTTNTCEIFNVKAVAPPYFKAAASMANSRMNHAAASLSSGNIFISGGMQWNSAESTFTYLAGNEIYNTGTDPGSWDSAYDGLLQGRAYHAITTLNGGSIIMITGGRNAGNFFNSNTEEAWYYANRNVPGVAAQNAGSHGYLDGAEFFDSSGVRVAINGNSYSVMPYRTSSHAAALGTSGRVAVDRGYGNIIPTFFDSSAKVEPGSTLWVDLPSCVGPDYNDKTVCPLVSTSTIDLLLNLQLSRPVDGRVVDGDAFLSKTILPTIIPSFTFPYTAAPGSNGTVEVYMSASTAPLDGLPVGTLIPGAAAGDFISETQLLLPVGTVVFSTTAVSSVSVQYETDYNITTSSIVIREMIFSNSLGFNPSNFTWDTTNPAYDSALPLFNHTYMVTPAGDELIIGGRNCESDPGTDCGAKTFTASTTGYVVIPVPDPAQNGGWTDEQPLQENRVSHTSTLLPDGSILTCGGSDGVRTSDSCELYLTTSTEWNYTGSMSSKRSRHTATLLPNGTVLITGGTTGYAAVATAEIYYPDIKRFRLTQSMSVTRQNHTATLLPDGNVLVAGGSSNTASEIFISTAAAWQTVGAMNATRSQHTATLLNNGNVLVTGGISGPALKTTEIYDSAARNWTAIASPDMNTARYSHTAILLKDGRVLVAGGSNGGGPLVSTELLQPPYTGAWVTSGDMEHERANHKATLLTNGKILLTGGETVGSVRSEADLYTTDFDVWGEYGNAVSRQNHTAVLALNGNVYIIGGWDGTQYLNSVQSVYFAGSSPDIYGMEPKNRNPHVSTAALDSATGKWGFVDYLGRGQPMTLLSDATNFHGITEASGGGAGSANSSFHNPRVYLQAMDAASGFLIDLTTGIYKTFTTPTELNPSWVNTLSSITVTLPPNAAAIPYGYYYARTAANGQYSNGRVVQVTVPRPTGLAGNILATAVNSSVTWTWDSGTIAGEVNGYAIFSSSNNLFIATATYVPASQVSYVQTGLVPNTAASIAVGAYNLGGYGPLSRSGTYYTYAAVPTGLTVTTASFETADLTWSPAGNSPKTPYELSVYEQSESDGELPFAYSANISTPIPFSNIHLSTSAVITTLTPNKNYSFRVRAMNSAGLTTGFSALASTTTVGNISNLQGSARTMSDLFWSWDASVGATAYSLYDATLATGTDGVLISSSIYGNSYTQADLSTNTAHSVCVRAEKHILSPIDNWISGPFSCSGSVYTKAVTPLPAANAFTAIGVDRLTANWVTNGNSSMTVYEVALSLKSDFTGSSVTHVTGSTALYTGLLPNYRYYAKVTAYNGDTKAAAPLNLGSVYTRARPPDQPYPSSISMSGVTINWSALDNSPETIYELVGSTDSFVSVSTYISFGYISPSIPYHFTGNTYAITGLLTQTTYDFKVTARNGDPKNSDAQNITLDGLIETADSMSTPNVLTLSGPGNAPAGSIGGLSDPAKDTVIHGVLPSGREISLSVPAASFAGATQIAISSFSSSGTNLCNWLAGGKPIEFEIFTQGNAQPQAPVTINFSYSSAESNAGIDANRARLVMGRYNARTGQCLPLETIISNNTNPRTITATLDHFSTFQLMLSTAAANLGNVRVYPNPIYVNRQPPVVHIINMPAFSKIRIYTLSGDKIWEGAAGADGNLVWPVANKSGMRSASGIYLAAIDSSAGKKIIKIAVER